MMAIDQAKCERSTRYRPRPKCLGNAFKRQAVNMVILTYLFLSFNSDSINTVCLS